MNNRGWGLEAMILWCAVLGILLIVATVMINSSINNMYNNTNSSSSVIKKEDKTPTKEEDDNKKDNEEVYSSYLEKMTSASKLYIEREYNDSLEQIDNMYLTTTFLTESPSIIHNPLSFGSAYVYHLLPSITSISTEVFESVYILIVCGSVISPT